MKITCKFIFLNLVVVFLSTAQADIGQIKTVEGSVDIVRDGNRQAAKPGNTLKQQDIIQTGSDGAIGITFIDNTRFSTGPNTTIELKRFQFNPTTQDGEFVTDVNRGTLAVVSGQIAKHRPDAMKIRLPNSILGVRGTTFLVKVKE